MRAGVERVLGRHAGGDRTLAFERRAGIEMRALGTGVQVALAARTLTAGTPGSRNSELGAAAGALHHLAEARHAEGLRRDRGLPAGRVFLLGLLGFALPRLTRLVLVAPLSIFALRHVGRSDCIAFRSRL